MDLGVSIILESSNEEDSRGLFSKNASLNRYTRPVETVLDEQGYFYDYSLYQINSISEPVHTQQPN
jgi:hypothetical protein